MEELEEGLKELKGIATTQEEQQYQGLIPGPGTYTTEDYLV